MKETETRSPSDELTIREAERDYYRDVSEATLRRRVRDGLLPCRRAFGRIILRREDVERVIYGAPTETKAAAR